MKDDGYHIMSETDCMELHYKFAEEKTGLNAWFENNNTYLFNLYIYLSILAPSLSYLQNQRFKYRLATNPQVGELLIAEEFYFEKKEIQAWLGKKTHFSKKN